MKVLHVPEVVDQTPPIAEGHYVKREGHETEQIKGGEKTKQNRAILTKGDYI